MVEKEIMIEKMGANFSDRLRNALLSGEYKEELGWFIMNHNQPTYDFKSYFSSQNSLFITEPGEICCKPVNALVVLNGSDIRENQSLSSRKEPYNNTIKKIGRYHTLHLVGRKIISYVGSSENSQPYRCNLFWGTPCTNTFQELSYSHEPMRLLEILIEKAIKEGPHENKDKIDTLYDCFHVDDTYKNYKLEEGKYLGYFVELLYANIDNAIASAIHLQAKSDDDKFYFNVIIPNIFEDNSRINYENGTIFS